MRIKKQRQPNGLPSLELESIGGAYFAAVAGTLAAAQAVNKPPSQSNTQESQR